MPKQTPWPRKHQQMLRLSDEGNARLELLERETGQGKSAAIDALLRALPLETLQKVVAARLERDAAGDEAWSRS